MHGRGKKIADRYIAEMTVKVGHIWIQGGKISCEQCALNLVNSAERVCSRPRMRVVRAARW